jgi:hypothetical protein
LFGWTADDPQEEFGGYFMLEGVAYDSCAARFKLMTPNSQVPGA